MMGAYTSVAPRSDHKTVVCQLGRSRVQRVAPRFRFPVEMLDDAAAVEGMKRRVQELEQLRNPHTAMQWWEQIIALLQEEGITWRRNNPKRTSTSLGAILRRATPVSVPPEGWELLQERGLLPETTRQAYSLVTTLWQDEADYEWKHSMTRTLQHELLTKGESHRRKQDRRRRVLKLMRELQVRKSMSSIKDSRGAHVTEPTAIAKAFKGFWGGVMKASGVTEEQCTEWMNSLPVPIRLRKALPALMQPLTESTVLVALEKMRGGTSPGADGLPTEVFRALAEDCVKPMLWAVQECLRAGGCPPAWVVSLQRNIPKTPMADMLSDMRPIALQNVVFKWLATVVLIQIQDALQILIPMTQKGFLKGRRMLDHIERARLIWETSDSVNLFLVDFAKAYDSVQHAFFTAALRFFSVPEPYVRLLVSALRGAVMFCIDSGYVTDVSMIPGSGIRQGDPLSPAIFALLTVFLIFLMDRDCPEAELLLYADDLLVSFSGKGRKRERVARKVIAALALFGYYSGLHINYKKNLCID